MSDTSLITEPAVLAFVQNDADPFIDQFTERISQLQQMFYENTQRYYQVCGVSDIPEMGEEVHCDWLKCPSDEYFAPANNPNTQGRDWPEKSIVQPRIDVTSHGEDRTWNALFSFVHEGTTYRRSICVTNNIEQHDQWEVIRGDSL